MDTQKPKEKIINIPNVLAMIRMLMVPVVIWQICKENMITALLLFFAACMTDVVDGYIARHYNLITQLGTWLDPMADKMMSVFVIITFTVKGILPLAVTVIIFLKELLMLIGGVISAKRLKYILASNKFGKIAALIFNTAIGSCFLYQYWSPYYVWFVWIALAGSVSSLIQYTVRNWRKVFPKESADAE